MASTPRIDRLERNNIINGNFDFWQRGASFVTASGYTSDRFQVTEASGGSVDVTRNTDVPTVAESGFQSRYSFRVDVNVADVSIGNEGVYISQRIEGNNYQSIHAKKAVLSFWVKSNKTGQYSCAFRNQAFDRSYVSPYTINVTDTWEKKEIALTLDSAGTWLFDNTIGIRVAFSLMAGPTFNTPDANKNQWINANATGLDSDVNFMDNAANYIQFSQVMLNEGEVAGAFSRSGRTIQEELANCQRYYEKSYDLDTVPGTATSVGRLAHIRSNGLGGQTIYYKVRKRVAANTTTLWTQGGVINNWFDVNSSVNRSVSVSNSGQWAMEISVGTAAALSGLIGHFTADAEL